MSYSLTVEANDFISPPHSDTANISITVRDTNDNSPVFSMPAGKPFVVCRRRQLMSAAARLVIHRSVTDSACKLVGEY